MKKHMRALVGLAVGVAMFVPSLGQADVAPASACVKQAPAEYTCNNGTHEIVGVEETTVLFVEPAFGAYTGRIRSVITNASGRVLNDYWCDYTGDPSIDVPGDTTGTSCTHVANLFPTIGETFTQKCYSYNLNSFTGKGNGVWTCALTHS
jgi:hypothetical protein